VIDPDTHNGLLARSAAQCQHVRSVAVRRIGDHLGNVGPVSLQQVRQTLAALLDL
jgi:mRNA interferase MazF